MSTNKTTNYQLHQWEARDDFLRSEFNENFAKLDEAVHGHIVTGKYTGDGEAERFISLGFTPRAVIIMPQNGQMNDAEESCYSGMALAESGAVYSSSRSLFEIVEGGIKLYHSSYRATYTVYVSTNYANKVYHYIAFR